MSRIVSLRVENFQRVKAVEIHPEGDVIVLSGRNEQGKSSVLDAIWAALGGKDHTSAMPIRKGEKEAFIEVDLGDLRVTKVIRLLDDGTLFPTLHVKTKDGGRITNGQAVLNKLVSQLTFDPLEFSRAKDQVRLELLRGLVTSFDFVAAAAQIDKAFTKRTDVNRDVNRLQAQFEGVAVDPTLPTERIDESSLVAQLERAGEANALAAQAGAERRQLTASITTAEARVDDLRKQLVDAEVQLEQLRAGLAATPEPAAMIDTSEIRAAIEEARQQNEAIDQNLRARRQKAQLKSELETKQAEADTLTAEIEKVRGDRDKAVAGAKLPVPGISFDDTKVMLDGVPFAQASTSKKIRASVAIASALNPGLRVIQVRDGSLLDSDAKKVIADFAAENDMQFWIEEVDETGQVGIVIEDGMIKAAPQLQAAE